MPLPALHASVRLAAVAVLLLAAAWPGAVAHEALGGGLGAPAPVATPLEVTRPESANQECLAMLAAEAPEQREAQLTRSMEYVRAFYPDADEASLRGSADQLLDERCQLPAYDPPAARLETLADGTPVVHFGGHSIQLDRYLSSTSAGTQDSADPVHLVFFGLPFELQAGPTIKSAMEASDWEGDTCGSDHYTTLWDSTHGGSTTRSLQYVDMQRVQDVCAGSRYHLRIWPSATGDTHTGETRGGYVVGAAHWEDMVCCWTHHVTSFDNGREQVRSALQASGAIDDYYYVTSDNYATADGDGLILFLHMKQPNRPCSSGSVVRIYEHTDYGGQCRAYDYDDYDFSNDRFGNGLGLNDQASSIAVASGFRARLWSDVFNAGTEKDFTCADPSLVDDGFNDVASSLIIEPWGSSCASFTGVRGNEWWVQANVGGPVTAVDVRANGGAWMALTKQTWGAWAASYHLTQGSIVQLRATMSGGAAQLSPCYQWIPPTNVDATVVSCNFPFDATFTNPNGNDWWVQVHVTANKPLTGVDARVNCGTWRPLALQSWGDWAASFNVPSGSTVDFRATAQTVESDTSRGYIWPTATPAGFC